MIPAAPRELENAMPESTQTGQLGDSSGNLRGAVQAVHANTYSLASHARLNPSNAARVCCNTRLNISAPACIWRISGTHTSTHTSTEQVTQQSARCKQVLIFRLGLQTNRDKGEWTHLA
jgi:hypothetical protein